MSFSKPLKVFVEILLLVLAISFTLCLFPMLVNSSIIESVGHLAYASGMLAL